MPLKPQPLNPPRVTERRPLPSLADVLVFAALGAALGNGASGVACAVLGADEADYPADPPSELEGLQRDIAACEQASGVLVPSFRGKVACVAPRCVPAAGVPCL